MFWSLFLLFGAIWVFFLRVTVGRLLETVAKEKMLQTARALWVCFIALLFFTGFGRSENLPQLHVLGALSAIAALVCTYELTRRAGVQRSEEQTRMMRQALSSHTPPSAKPQAPPIAPQATPPPADAGTYHQVYPRPARLPELHQKLVDNIFVSPQSQRAAQAYQPPQAPVVTPARLEPVSEPVEAAPHPADVPVAPAPVLPAPLATAKTLASATGLARPAGPISLGSGMSSRPAGPVSLGASQPGSASGFSYQAQMITSRIGGQPKDARDKLK